MNIVNLPSLDRTSPTFRDDLDDYFSTKLPTFGTQANAVAAEVNQNKQLAEAAAQTAAAKADAAAAAAGTAGVSAGAAAGSAGAAAASAGAAGNAKDAASLAAGAAAGSQVAAAQSAGEALAAAVSATNTMPTGAAAGTANAITVATVPVVAMAPNRAVVVRFGAANTSTVPTLAINGGAAYPIKARGGVALQPGDILGAGFVGVVVGNAAGNAWELINPGVAVALETRLAYDNRGDLRTMAGIYGQSVSVAGLGRFAFVAGSTELDDDESCFTTAGGAWELDTVAPGYVRATVAEESNAIGAALDERRLFGRFNMTLTNINANSSVAFLCGIPGVEPGDAIAVGPRNPGTSPTASAYFSYHGICLASGIVTVYIKNSGSGALSSTPGSWTVVAIKK